MGKIRDSARTRKRILDAAAEEFSERGYDGTTITAIARRAGLSKQLIHHHFGSKEGLFQETLDSRFRPTVAWEGTLPDNGGDLIAERFRKRARDLRYIRFLTWEAAGGRSHDVPGQEARQRRVAEYGMAIRLMQAEGQLPADLDYRLIQLAVLSLATYPLAFKQITRLVTGRLPTDSRFQREWYEFLRKIGHRLFESGSPSSSRRRRRVSVRTGRKRR